MDTGERDPGCVYVNGVFSAPSQARLPALDRGVLYGDGLFETLRTYGGAPFRLREHLARLEAGLRVLEVAGAPPLEALERWTRETLGRAGLPEATLRLTLTRGVGPPGLDPAGCDAPTVMVAALPLRAWPEACYRDGIAAALLWARAAVDCPPPTVKSTSYQRQVLARAELARRGAREGFFLDGDGAVLEGTTSNVFAVRGGVLFTPPVGCCLAGITRAEVLALARAAGRAVQEVALSRELLASADELFITSALAELVPVVSVDGHPVGHGRPGPVTQGLHRQYLEVARAAGGTP